MQLVQALRLSPYPPATAIAFTGAGGKTTALFQLARQLPAPVVVTTTTHLGLWQAALADNHVVLTRPQEIAWQGVTLISAPARQDERLEGVNESVLYWLYEISKDHSRPLLIEADGARQKPLKAPGEHEPPIPLFAAQVIVVAGLQGVGKRLNEVNVHRPAAFAHLSGLEMEGVITPQALARLLKHPRGGLKNIPPRARRIALLNQADSPELQAVGKSLADALLPSFDSVLIASLTRQEVFAVHEPVAAVILAAGESRRLGQPKQLLSWRGEPFVRQVAQAALQANLSPVVVVSGAYAEGVEKAVEGLPVQLVRNEAWRSGQSSSIRLGVEILRAGPDSPLDLPQEKRKVESGAAIFLLADQPQVTPEVLRALCERHAATLAPIVAPLVQGQRANPVLFDRCTFSDLETLEGDVGGRAIFSRHRVEYLPWHDEQLLLDVDTQEDYQRLLGREEK